MEIKITSNSVQETLKISRTLSGLLDFGDLLILEGELGGGKTTFLNGIADGLGIDEDLTSPSFTLVNVYGLKGDKRLVHIDLYRLDDIEEISDTEINDHIEDDRAITCVEWGGKLKGYINKDYLNIGFRYVLDDDSGDALEKRKITLKSSSIYWDRILKDLKGFLNDNFFD